MTRREVRALREAQEAGLRPDLVEPDNAPTLPRSSIANPVSLPEVEHSNGSPALPPEAAAATRVSVASGSGAPGSSVADAAAASTASAPAAAQPVDAAAVSASASDAPASASSPAASDRFGLSRAWTGRSGRRSAHSAHSAVSVQSAPTVEQAAEQSAPVEAGSPIRSADATTVQGEAAASADAPDADSMPGDGVRDERAAGGIVSSTPLVESAPAAADEAFVPLIASTPISKPEPAAPAARDGESAAASRYGEFDSLIDPDGSGSSINSSALVLPMVPGHTDLPRALDSTGEIIMTGSFSLPASLAETGAHHPGLDGLDVDRLMEADDSLQVSTDSRPVRASRAVSTHTATRGIIQPTRPRSNRLLTALAISASVLAVGVVALLVIGVLNGVFF